MKKILLSLSCIFTVLSVSAQSEGLVITTDSLSMDKSEVVDAVTRQHLTFKGIPIDGTPEKFGEKLTELGFVYSHKSQGSYWYEGGSFAGFHDCEVIVKAYDNLVYEVVAILPARYKWSHLYDDYSSLVYSLKKKYGEPDYSKEEFVSTPSYIDLDDDNDKYSEVKDGHCKYYTGFSVGYGLTGSVHIEIKASGRVGLHYADGYNEYLKSRAVENDL